jgi:hypothetical protein
MFQAYKKAQAGVEGASKGRTNTHFNNKYADLTSVYEACASSFHANGFGIIQIPGEMKEGGLEVTTALVHESGGYICGTFTIPVKDRTDPQKVGSNLTYARRYALAAMTGVCPEDDDGNAGAKIKEVSIDLPALETQVAGAEDKKTLTAIWNNANLPSTPEAQKTQLSALIKAKMAELKGKQNG